MRRTLATLDRSRAFAPLIRTVPLFRTRFLPATDDRLSVTYHVRADAADIEARARAIAVEQSVEMPPEAIDDSAVLADIVGRVEDILDLGDGRFAVRIGLASATIGADAGQLMTMLFGNASLLDDVTLADCVFPPGFTAAFGGPRHGIDGLRRRAGRPRGALTCSALKPLGLPAERLGELAGRLAMSGLDFIKDDHGIGDQALAPFARRVTAVAARVRAANRATGGATRYVPSLTGDLDQLRTGAAIARNEGLDTVMVAPLVAGLPAFRALAAAFPDLAFIAHPAMAGAARILPPLLLGTLFRLVGADATIFPHHGGRFGYSPATCRSLADRARRSWRDGATAIAPTLPVPAGGMSPERVAELLDFYGDDTMLLIGGSLLAAEEGVTAAASSFASAVRRHGTAGRS